MATLKDVAQLAGVSATTVSIIVNGKAKQRQLSQTTIDRVNDAIRKLNYQPSISARALRSTEAPAFTVGIYWVSDFRSAFLSRFLTGIQNKKLCSDVNMNIVICPYKANELSAETALYQSNTYNAVIIANASERDMKYIHDNPIPIPTVLSNRESELYHTVFIDNIELGRKAARHLLERNVKNIGIISLNDAYFSMNSSTKGFFEVSREHSLILKPEHLISTGFTMDEGYEAGKSIINSGSLPEGIFCDNDSSAIGLIRAFREHQIRIPEEVQVIGVGLGNLNYTNYTVPSITVVDVPLEILAEQCLTIVEKIATHEAEELIHLKFDSTLYQRDSTSRISAECPGTGKAGS